MCKEKLCPICHTPMKVEFFVFFQEERCVSNIEDHFYCAIIPENSSTISKQKIRLKDNDHNLVIVMDHEQQICQVWRDDDKKKISIPISFQIDFSDLDKIKQRIKTYLLFG